MAEWLAADRAEMPGPRDQCCWCRKKIWFAKQRAVLMWVRNPLMRNHGWYDWFHPRCAEQAKQQGRWTER